MPLTPKSVQNLKLRLNPKITENTKPKPGGAPAVLIQSNEDRQSEESEEDMPIVRKRIRLIPGSELSAKVNNSVAVALRGCIRDKNNKEGNEETVLGSTRVFARLSTDKAINMPELPEPVPINSITPAPVETSAERAIKVKKELAARTKEVEEMKREPKEIEERAAAEKAAAEEAAIKKAAAEKAAAETAAVEKAAAKLTKENAELDLKAVGKSLKHMGESIKHAISAYLAQRAVEAADKALVKKLDEELALYFLDALKIAASKPQKRKFKKEETNDKRPEKVASK